MIEIYPNLFVGSKQDYEAEIADIADRTDEWRVVQACKIPFHCEALRYTGAAPEGDPERLVARRGSRLILNLLDHEDPRYIPKVIIDESLAFIAQGLVAGRRVLVHCNRGYSRGPSIGLLYLAAHTEIFDGLDFHEAEDKFRELYPDYFPKSGIRGFIARYWDGYCRGRANVELANGQDEFDLPGLGADRGKPGYEVTAEDG